MKTILTPERSQSTACVQLRAPGDLYIQAFDAYGFQRELTLRETGAAGSFQIMVYQHPGRRGWYDMSRAQGRKLMAALIARAESEVYSPLMFNPEGLGHPRNAGFVRFCEAAFRGASPSDLLKMI